MKFLSEKAATFWLCLLSTFCFSLSLPAAERVALVIGVDSYDHLPKNAQLSVAVDDAKAMAKTLENLDPAFAVTLLTDTQQNAAEKAFDEYLDAAKGAECALVYFAGHGIEYFGTNYLIVKDTRIDNESADVARMKRRLGNEALSLQAMVDSLDGTGAKVKLVVLDCCRDNPLEAQKPSGTRSTVGGRSGLAQVTPPSGTLISYSADAGQRANDGLFTAVLIDQIENSGLPLPQVFASTRVKVREISTKWAAEDAEKGLPPEYRRVRHEPAEYVKLDPAAYQFRFSQGAPREVKTAEESAEMLAMRQQVESLKATIEELRKAGVENEALKKQLDAMEKSVGEAETKARTEPEVAMPVAPTGNFPAGTRSMEGSKAGEARTIGGIEFVWCPPTGEDGFLMGSPESEVDRGDDEKQHRVVLTEGFWLAKTECTQGQWESVMGSNPSNFDGSKNLPVETVSWDDCQGWLVKMNEKHPLPEGWKWVLPTEAQWEYACRAGTETAYVFGNRDGDLHKFGNFADKNFTKYSWGDKSQDDGVGNQTAEVGSYEANAWGLLDMHGNVWEWCGDWYGEDSYSDGQRDPKGPNVGSFRVGRGGGWDRDGHYCRSADRAGFTPDGRNDILGFRLVVSSAP